MSSEWSKLVVVTEDRQEDVTSVQQLHLLEHMCASSCVESLSVVTVCGVFIYETRETDGDVAALFLFSGYYPPLQSTEVFCE